MKTFTTLSLLILLTICSYTNAQTSILQATFPSPSTLATGAASNQDIVALDADIDGIIEAPTVSYILNTVIEEAPITSGGGEAFTFYYNQNDQDHPILLTNIPWNTKSRKSGKDMFGYCNLDVATTYTDLRMLTPSFDLEAGKTYTFKQNMQNPNIDNGTAAFGFALMSGTPDTFDPANIGTELGSIDLNTTAKVDLTIDNLTAPSAGTYYFVIYLKSVTPPATLPLTASIRFYATSLTENTPTNISNLSSSAPKVYPSPAYNTISISQTKGKVSIYSITGSCVKSINEYNGGNLDISDLPKGTYILKTNTSTSKFIKL